MIEIAAAHNFVAMSGLSIFLLLNIPRVYWTRCPGAPRWLWAWVLLSGIYVCLSPIPPYRDALIYEENYLQAIIDAKSIMEHAAKALLAAFIIPCVVIFISRSTAEQLLFMLECMAVVESVLTLIFGHGIFNPDSLGTTYIAAIYPVMILKPSCINTVPRINRILEILLLGLWIVLPVAAIIYSRAATPIFMLIGSIGIYLLLTRRYLFAIGCAIAIASIGLITQGHHLTLSRGRWEAWKLFMSWWLEYGNHWTGTGLGTFYVLGPVIQAGDSGQYLYLHNEYLQILFELGWIGLILFLFLSAVLAIRSFRRPWLIATLVGVSIGLSTQFLFRYAGSALFLVLLVRMVFEDWDESRRPWLE